MRNSWSWAGFIAALLVAGTFLAEARADAIKAVTFTAGKQGLWGPGASSNSLDKGGKTGSSAGVGFNVDDDTGSVWGTYGGTLKLLGATSHDLASGSYGLGSSFAVGSGKLSTSFGAQVDVFGFALGKQLSAPGFPKGNTLKVTQSSKFKPTSINGTLSAYHAATNTLLTTSYSIGGALGLALNQPGSWVLSLDDLKLANTLSTGMDGAVGGYIDVIAVPRLELTTKNFDLFDGKSFGMKFNQHDWTNAMTVNVFDSSAIVSDPTTPQPTPEPGTIVLIGAVGAAVALRRWRGRRQTR